MCQCVEKRKYTLIKIDKCKFTDYAYAIATAGFPVDRCSPNLRSTDHLLPDGRAMVHLVFSNQGLIETRNAGYSLCDALQKVIGPAQRRINVVNAAKSLSHARDTADGHPFCCSAKVRGRVISARLS